MLSPAEREEFRQALYQDLIAIEDEISRHAGTYEFLCLLGGAPTFCHSPVGPVIRRVYRVDRAAA